MAPIHFFIEDVDFQIPKKLPLKKWVRETVHSEEATLGEINFIFCSDEYLHNLNLQFLNHDNYTDILTFDRSEGKDKIDADVFISINRISENSKDLKQEFEEELKRVMIHGIFHLLGYKDGEAGEKELMRQKENEALGKWAQVDVPRGTS